MQQTIERVRQGESIEAGDVRIEVAEVRPGGSVKLVIRSEKPITVRHHRRPPTRRTCQTE